MLLQIVIIFCVIISSLSIDYGYYFDGADDHLSFAVSTGTHTYQKFSLQIWLRNDPKDKFGNLEQCIVSHGSWEGRFKLSLTGLSNVQITINNDAGKLLDCHVVPKLNHGRWYNFVFTYNGDEGILKTYLNGIDSPTSCTDASGRILLGGNLFTGGLRGSSEPFTVGACHEGESGPEKLLFRGHLAGLRIYDSVLNVENIRDVIAHWDPVSAEHPVPLASQPLLLNQDGTPFVPQTHVENHAAGLSLYHVHGHPTVHDLNLGETHMSVMHTVATTKLAILAKLNNTNNTADTVEAKLPETHESLGALFTTYLGQLARFTIDDKLGNDRIVSTLTRHFRIAHNERSLWQRYNEYSIRLEMLGHTVAMLVHGSASDRKEGAAQADSPNPKQTGADFDPVLPGTKPVLSILLTPQPCSQPTDVPRPLVAVIVPATSLGVRSDHLASLPLMRSLLPSLYRTMSSGFRYRVYLTINAGDALYSDKVATDAMFRSAYEHWGNDGDLVEHRVVIVPDSVVPKRALSALFNIPTLVAHADGAQFFYIVNDDLMLTSLGWTELFAAKLLENPVFPGLGVAGGVDTSDVITPQIEFPFFHRTHVDIFRWCGANPWTFRNWWEDNWVHDVYLPFSSVFYVDAVTVRNYAGLDKPAEGSGSADPRYEVIEGRHTPPFYRTEVEQARRTVLRFIERSKGAGLSLSSAEAGSEGSLLSYLSDKDLDFCTNAAKSPPTLAIMPVAPHEEPLDPCNLNLDKLEGRMFQSPVHETELPHGSYAELLAHLDTKRAPPLRIQNPRSETCRIDTNAAQAGDCPRALGLDLLPAYLSLPLINGELCAKNKVTANAGGAVSPAYSSCFLSRPLRLLIVHNHCPLFTRYGSDKRLYHLAETLIGLGHNVTFAGSQVSGLETADDHKRLQAIGVRLLGPLLHERASDKAPININRAKYREVLKSTDPDLVIMTLWFWNIPPAPELYIPLTRELSPLARIAVVSDDAHAHREMRILKERLELEKAEKIRQATEPKNETTALISEKTDGETDAARVEPQAPAAEVSATEEGPEKGKAEVAAEHPKTEEHMRKQVEAMRLREYRIYRSADVVMTITDVDRENILSGDPVSATGERLMPVPPEKIHTVRYALSPTEIIPVPGIHLWTTTRGHLNEFNGREGLVFVGNGANPTNKVSIDWLLSEVYPGLQKDLPGIKLRVIGADWDYLKVKYNNTAIGEFLDIKGLLSQEDMGWELIRARVFVSPMVASTGLNTKNVLAISRGVPLVTTSCGAQGLRLPPSNRPSEQPCLVVDGAEQFVASVKNLYTNSKLWLAVSRAAVIHARNVFSLQAQAHDLEEAINSAFLSASKGKTGGH